jgi:hypothetical protein
MIYKESESVRSYRKEYKLRPAIKLRNKERLRLYRLKNIDKIKAQQRAWRKNYPEKARASCASWVRRHPIKIQEYQLKAKYGLTPSALAALILRQKNCCAICHSRFINRNLNVDHDHKTGAVRGLLCSRCNWGIGHLRDDPSLLVLAIEYLTPEFFK